MARDWSATENRAVVTAYFDMLRQEMAHQPYSKAAARRAVMSKIDRSEGSVEYKMQNVSAALQLLHCPFIDGYKPAMNLQSDLMNEVRHRLDTDEELLSLMTESIKSTPAPRLDLVWAEIEPPAAADPPADPSFDFEPMPIDFVRLEESNRKLGLVGEQAVLVRERSQLIAQGRPDLADRVAHISVEQGDGAGFDILSFTPRGEERFLEVKTTRRGKNWPMCVSRNEVQFSRQEAPRFELHRVFHFDKPELGIYVLRGAIPDTCWLSPLSYQAIPKVG